jgi:hypothetical protein
MVTRGRVGLIKVKKQNLPSLLNVLGWKRMASFLSYVIGGSVTRDSRDSK